MSVKESVILAASSGTVDAAALLPAGVTPVTGVILLFVAVFAVRAFVSPRPFGAVPAAKRALANRSYRASSMKRLRDTVKVMAAPGSMPDALASSHDNQPVVPPAPSSHKLLQVAFTALLDEVFVFSPETHKLFFVNARAETRLIAMNLKQNKAVFTDLLPVEYRQVVIDSARTLQRSGLDAIVFEFPIGGAMTELTLKLIREGDGTAFFMAILRDISARGAQAKIQSGYISTLSHEMRTPLTSVKGAVDLVASGRLGEIPASAISTLNVAQRNVERLLRLTNDILDLEKMDSGKWQIDLQPVEVMDLVRAATQEIHGYAREFDVQVTVEALIEGGQIKADRTRLLQVMSNLLSNAIKYSTPKSAVTIRVEDAGEDICVRVLDHGPGIPEDMRSDLFEPYQQGPQVQTKVASTGLGLSIAKRIVEAHGGSIGVSSVAGEGANFYFMIPKVINHQEVAA
jgi:signal transduction histidine kinase